MGDFEDFLREYWWLILIIAMVVISGITILFGQGIKEVTGWAVKNLLS